VESSNKHVLLSDNTQRLDSSFSIHLPAERRELSAIQPNATGVLICKPEGKEEKAKLFSSRL